MTVSENSNQNNKINKVNSKNLAYYVYQYNNTVILLNLIGYLSGDILIRILKNKVL